VRDDEVDWPDWFNPEVASDGEKAAIKHEYVDTEPQYIVYSVEKDGELISGVYHSEADASLYASEEDGKVVELVKRGEAAVLDNQIEPLAELAHRLWTYWSQHITEEEDISEDRLERWEGLWIPYEAMGEEDQEDDQRLVKRFLSEKPDYSVEIDTTGDTQSN